MSRSTIHTYTVRVKEIDEFREKFENNESIRLCVDHYEEINGEQYYVLTQNNQRQDFIKAKHLAEPIIFLCKATDLTKNFKTYKKINEPLASVNAFLIKKIIDKNVKDRPVVILSHEDYAQQVKDKLVQQVKEANSKGERLILKNLTVFNVAPRYGVWLSYKDANLFLPNRLIGGQKNKRNPFFSYRAYDLYNLGDTANVAVIIDTDFSSDVVCEPEFPFRDLSLQEKLSQAINCLNVLQIGYITATQPRHQYVHTHEGFDVMCYPSAYQNDNFVPVVANDVVGKCVPLTRKAAQQMLDNNEAGSENIIKAKYVPGTDLHGHERVLVKDTAEIQLEDTVEYNDLKSEMLNNNDEIYVKLTAVLVRGKIGGTRSLNKLLSIYRQQNLSKHPKVYTDGNKDFKIV
jgi:hypothetical protein